LYSPKKKTNRSYFVQILGFSTKYEKIINLDYL
jgi:hypothetical protein